MAKRRLLLRFFVAVVLLTAVFAAGWVVGRLRIGAEVPRASLTDLEREFTDRMEGAALVGFFTIGARDTARTSPDRYDIASVEKVGEDLWRFNARMRYGNIDVTLPITVPMEWVDDTPIITLTDFSIPTMGTFNARVFFHGDQYAGTWAHVGRAGGFMFGRIERGGAELPEPE